MSSTCVTFLRIRSKFFKFVDTKFQIVKFVELAHEMVKQEIMSLSTPPSPEFINISQKLMSSRQLMLYLGKEK